jgi:AraC-like DNA-binding protein
MAGRERDTADNLSGLRVAIALKADLLHRLGTHDAARWPADVQRFVAALERSRLSDGTALVVLLTEVREELRLLLGVGSPGARRRQLTAPTPSPLDAWTDLPKRDILRRFSDEILDMLSSATPTPHRRLSPIVKRTKQTIDDAYAEPLTLQRLAASVGCSRRQLAALFRRELAMTVREYLTRARLRRALELILDGQKIEAVSLMVGYHSKKNFYRQFKARVGVTPSAYRAALVSIR